MRCVGAFIRSDPVRACIVCMCLLVRVAAWWPVRICLEVWCHGVEWTGHCHFMYLYNMSAQTISLWAIFSSAGKIELDFDHCKFGYASDVGKCFPSTQEERVHQLIVAAVLNKELCGFVLEFAYVIYIWFRTFRLRTSTFRHVQNCWSKSSQCKWTFKRVSYHNALELSSQIFSQRIGFHRFFTIS